MILNIQIQQELTKNHNAITTKQVIRLGFSRSILTTYTKAELLFRARRGVYIPIDVIHDDMFTLSLRYPDIIFSHISALTLFDLTECIPTKLYITVPKGKTVSPAIRKECRVFSVEPELLNLGITHHKTMFGNIIPCYNKERTICDMLRDEQRMDIEHVIYALRSYMQLETCKVNRLKKYAKLFKVDNILNNYMSKL